MTAVSEAHALSLAISARVANITIANGYLTDIGTQVFRGKLKLTVDEMPCTVIVEADPRIADSRPTEVRAVLRYIIEGHDQCDPDQPNDKAHAIIVDLKKCIFGGDTTFGGLVRKDKLTYVGHAIGTREDGANVVAASIQFDCEIHEDLKNP